jgi:hypothetical protein
MPHPARMMDESNRVDKKNNAALALNMGAIIQVCHARIPHLWATKNSIASLNQLGA